MSETIFAFQARAERHFSARLAEKDRELRRARTALRLEAAKLSEERARGRAALDALERLRAGYRGQASPAHYVAIVALLRVQRALAGER
ncbi:MAG: hypothetical protein AMXMBFR56_65730 [Polyangiaceae bacterium]